MSSRRRDDAPEHRSLPRRLRTGESDFAGQGRRAPRPRKRTAGGTKQGPQEPAVLRTASTYPEILELLWTAVAQRRCVRMVYHTAYRDAVMERVVEPLEIRPERGGYLLIAYCRWRREVRSFAPSQVLSATLLEERFEPRRVPTERLRPSRTFEPMSTTPIRTVGTTGGGTGCLASVAVLMLVLLVVLG